MDFQKFIPEGWEENPKNISKESLNSAINDGKVMQGFVSKCDSNYNLYVDFGDNLKGVIPRNEVEAINSDGSDGVNPRTCIGKVNKYVQFKVKGITDNDIYVLSRKEVENDAIKWINRELEEGQIVKGIVRNIKPYGAFVEIGGGIAGLLHIEDISVARIKNPIERLEIGQKTNFVVKSIDRASNRVLLSYKELLGTWEENAEKFEEGSIVKGIVRETEKAKNGIFIELAPNLVGMAEYKEGIEYGQNVDVYIKRIIPEKKKVKLLIV